MLRTFNAPTDQLVVWCTHTYAFCVFIRASEFCSARKNTFVVSSTLLSKLVEQKRSTVTVQLLASKTEQMRRGTADTLHQTKRLVWPVNAYQNFIGARKPHNHPALAFSYFRTANPSRVRFCIVLLKNYSRTSPMQTVTQLTSFELELQPQQQQRMFRIPQCKPLADGEVKLIVDTST